jgi:Subtilase family
MLKRFFTRRSATVGGGLLLIAVLLVAAASASAAAGWTPASHGGMPAASGHLQKVIVFLRSRSAGHPGKVRAEVAPLANALRAHGAKHVSAGIALPFVTASVSSGQTQALKVNSAVQAVLPDVAIAAPTSEISPQDSLIAPLTTGTAKAKASTSAPCGTAAAPEQDPEALGVIKAPAAFKAGIDGAGVKTAYIAGTIDTTIPDFQRNSKYASAGSPAGSPVVTAVDFTGDPAVTPDPSDGDEESFGDAGSIAAQGNKVFDLSKFVSSSHPLRPHCDITITGTAPGATVLGEDVFSNKHLTTTSNFIQAIQYAVAHGIQVLNESFGGSPFPDTALDAVRIADEQAVAAGVTVVVSTGDSGVTNTLGSPATDPNVIAVGATTTFRAYQQETYGGINAKSPRATNGKWLNNNISSLSSAGFSQAGGTVDLVAPGDLGWSECSSNTAIYKVCKNENGKPSGMQLFGGTSQSAPLTAGAAADVIQAYKQTHSGQAPSPALVKQILTSTATDISAPAEQQGAGLLNIGAAVNLAESIGVSHGPGGLLISPNQIDITQNTGATASKTIDITNEGSNTETVQLATRTLDKKVASHTGSFCLNPKARRISCGPPTAKSLVYFSGIKEVYAEKTFKVPHTNDPSRLNVSATYPAGPQQTSPLHVALFAPGGAYAGYSEPQGFGNYANVQVANPKAGTWTAVFFTVKNSRGEFGTQGKIRWEADTWSFGKAGSITPSSLTLAPGQTQSATFTAQSPNVPGDKAESILVNSDSGRNTIPVTIRTLVKIGSDGGTFKGVLTGGNGRDLTAATHTFAFDVPSGLRDLDVSVSFKNGHDDLIAFLQDPEGNTVASSSNVTLSRRGACCIFPGSLTVYKDDPEAGRWTLALDWLPPVATDSFSRVTMPFTGKIQFNKVQATSSDLPNGATLNKGQTFTYHVTVKNTSSVPQAFFLDPRASGMSTYRLPDQNGTDQNMSLPVPPSSNPLTPPRVPLYMVPTDTTEVETSLSGNRPVTYDFSSFMGDPDLSPELSAPTGDNPSMNFAPAAGEVAPGLWQLIPSEVGPYGPGGAPHLTATATFSVVTQSFDSAVDPSTGDLWSAHADQPPLAILHPVYLKPGQSSSIPLTIRPSASSGTSVTGSIKVDDIFQANVLDPKPRMGGDELASLPYSYTVG